MRHLILLTILLTLPAAADGPPFENAADWRLDFRHHHAGSGEYYMVETMGSGVAIFDVDDDGDPDVLFVDGGPLPGYTDEPPRTRLFRNDRTPDGPRFVDVTEGSGIEVVAYGMGATAGDVDGDGDLDLFISSFGCNQLFENLGDGTFRDVTDRAGTAVGDARFAASAAFGDPDVDGDLDLYVTSYVDFALDHNIVCGAERYGRRSYCHPDVYEGVPDLYLENRGDGTFEDATERTGFGGTAGKGLGVVWSDLDVDGDLDLYVANDITFNLHYENVGWRDDGPPFEDVAILYGTAASDLGTPEASMGLAVGDIGGDLRPEVFVTHFNLETNALYSSQPGGLFIDRRFASGLAEPSVGHLGFGNALADFDLDGDLDAVVANGHIIPGLEVNGEDAYRQRNQLYENVGTNGGDGRFREVGASGLDIVRVSRGLAVGDLDGDGDLDLAINNSNDLAEVYRNTSVDRKTGVDGAFLQVDPRAAAGNRFGIGARVEIEAAGKRQVREIMTGSSYLSQHDLTLHFGLGAAEAVESLKIFWPDGRRLEVRGVPVNRRVRIGDPGG